MKIRIGMAALSGICETACKAYRQELVAAEFFCDIKYIFDSLANVMRLWEAVFDNFDVDDELVLTIERREEQDDDD